ncbi:MAG: MATE family efflux transporter [Pseudomonadota bacterium]
MTSANPASFRQPPNSYAHHAEALMRLAAPVILSRTGVVAISVVDLAMVSYFSTQAVAELAAAQQILMFLIVLGLGLLMGTLVLTAQAFGAGDHHRAGRVWRRSLPYAAVIGAMAALASISGPFLFTAAGVEPTLIPGAARAMIAYGLGMPGHFIAIACAFFLEGINRPLWVSASIVLANILNLVLNAVFIFGALGLPGLGATGAALATSLVRWALAGLLVWRIWTLDDHARFGIRVKDRQDAAGWRKQRQLGYAAGASLGAEVAGFSALGVIAGRLGIVEMATYGLVFQVQSVAFMLASGLGTATTVRVGMALAAGGGHDARRAAWTGLGLCLACLAVVALGYVTVPEAILTVFGGDTVIIATALPVMGIAGAALLVDGSQFLLSNALRGYGETWAPTLIQGLAFLGVMIPLALWLTEGVGLGLVGLFLAVAGGCGLSVALQGARMVYLGNAAARLPQLRAH